MPRFKRDSSRSIPMLAGLVILSLTGSVYAQDALGDGTALDANAGQQGRKNFQRPDFAQELSFRNSIATGNAPGGLSFRGDLGYRAVGEFSGDLGSDSLFAFRRDSLYSGLAGMGIRGTDALQYQFSLTTGAAPPKNLMGNLSLARDSYYNPQKYSSGYGAGSARSNTLPGLSMGSSIGINPEGTDLNASSPFDSGSMLGTLRSSSTYATTTTLQPSLLSVYTEGVDNKPIGLIASPLLGITATPMAQDDAKPQNPLVARPANAITNPAVPGGLESTRIISSYDQLVEQMRTRVETMRQQSIENQAGKSTIKDNETNDAWLIRQMQDLSLKVYGSKPANDGDPNAKSNDPAGTDPTNPGDSPSTITPIIPENSNPGSANRGSANRGSAGPDSTGNALSISPLIEINNDPENPISKAIRKSLGGIDSNLSGVKLYDPTAIAIDPETLDVLRGQDAREIDQLLDPGAANRDIYSEHIVAGQRLLHQSRFFDAEERFAHALSIRPGDITAQIGRLHAQIGAGMVLSASVNLQMLLIRHPEIISSRYSDKLLPTKERSAMLVELLKERSGIAAPTLSKKLIESDRVRQSSALLLSYLGYQLDDQESIVSGLELVKELGADTDRRFVSLLAQVWLGHDLDESAPNQAPQTNPTGAHTPEPTPDQ